MSLRTGYINGERVYVSKNQVMVRLEDECLDFDEIQSFTHRDIVRMLNKFLKRIERADDELMKRMQCGRLLWGIIESFARYGESGDLPHFEVIKEDSIPFDNPQAIKRAKCRRLQHEKKIDKRFLKPVIIRGGLYESPEANTPIDPAGLLSETFKVWRREQGTKNEEG